LYNETGRSGNVFYKIEEIENNTVKIHAKVDGTSLDAEQYYNLIDGEKPYEVKKNINEILNGLIEKLEG